MATVDSTMFDRRTDCIVDILRDDLELGERLPDEVVVLKGPRLHTTNQFEVWVWWVGLDAAEYTLGGQQVKVEASYAVACVVRLAGNPEELESYTAILAANVFRCLCTHKLVSGYWHTAFPTSSTSLPAERDESDQWFEVNIFMHTVRWEEDVPDED